MRSNCLRYYEGKNIKITDSDGVVFRGHCFAYIFPEDNENDKESIAVEIADGRLIEFYEYDIASIEVIPSGAELEKDAV